ncbi:MAG: hypothetical protein M3539_17610 [Acidobacteriota bacterium]|nr:hypothetical protein [Acidobacteriota bacterium]
MASEPPGVANGGGHRQTAASVTRLNVRIPLFSPEIEALNGNTAIEFGFCD